MPSEIKLICTGCNKHPDEIDEYRDRELFGALLTPDQIVASEEGTYNPDNGHFLCTSCYIAAGMPSSPMGWKAP